MEFFRLEDWGIARSLWVTEWVFRFLLSVHVVTRRRPVQVVLAWLVVVLALPMLGALLYILVGDQRLGRSRIREYNVIRSQVEPLVVERWRARDLTIRASPWGGTYDHVARCATAVGGMPALKGNTLRLIGDTDEYLRMLIRDIDRATSHCHFLYYIYMQKGLADQVCKALIRAAGRGVECKVLADAIGSKKFLESNLADQMRRGGVSIVPVLPVGLLRGIANRLDLRNHRKLAIIDGLIAYTGSQNLTDTTFHFRKRRKVGGPWIDASVRVEGPAVQALGIIFLRDLAMETDESPVLDERYLRKEAERAEGESYVQVVPSGPGPNNVAMREALLTSIYAAHKELIITTPYFVPDEATESALAAAARRGVDVTIVVPRKTDTALVAVASRAHYETLMEAGARIFLYKEGLLHAKTMTVDGRLSLLGSANVDMRSFWLNFELSVFVYDERFAQELRALQHSYLAGCEEVNPDTWKARPWERRLPESFARLLGPLL